MKKALFEELRQSVEEGAAILRGRRKPSRAFPVGEPDVRAVRESYRLSQTRFAALMGISPGTLRNWEQGRRKPEAVREFCCESSQGIPRLFSMSLASQARDGAPNARLQRTRLRSPLSRQPLGGREELD